LIYRLSGDLNPLHIEPAIGRAAGFRQPILHGLATYGVAAYAVVQAVCGGIPERIQSMAARFTAPVYPGETLRTEIWRDGHVISYQTKPLERDVIAISGGKIVLNP
jgi:acyl dehydratase